MRIYVAGSSADRAAVARVIQELGAADITVTHDWTKSPEYERQLSDGELAEQALLDLHGVERADILWIYLGEKSEGAHAELGYALALGKHVVASGPITSSQVFPHLAHSKYETHEEALEAVVRARFMWQESRFKIFDNWLHDYVSRGGRRW